MMRTVAAQARTRRRQRLVRQPARGVAPNVCAFVPFTRTTLRAGCFRTAVGMAPRGGCDMLDRRDETRRRQELLHRRRRRADRLSGLEASRSQARRRLRVGRRTRRVVRETRARSQLGDAVRFVEGARGGRARDAAIVGGHAQRLGRGAKAAGHRVRVGVRATASAEPSCRSGRSKTRLRVHF